MAAEMHVGDVGTALIFLVRDQNQAAVDLSDYVSLTLLIVKPSGVKTTRVLTVVGEPEDGVVQYVTVAGDLDEAGQWRFQVKAVFLSTLWRSSISLRNVDGNLD